MKTGCYFCLDEDGDNCYPWYGLAPHSHSEDSSGRTKKVLDGVAIPSNFVPDAEDKSNMYGTYTHCLKCGAHN